MNEKDSKTVLLRQYEVAKMLGVSRVSIYEWTRAGKFPKPLYLTPGGVPRWRRSDIEALVNQGAAQ